MNAPLKIRIIKMPKWDLMDVKQHPAAKFFGHSILSDALLEHTDGLIQEGDFFHSLTCGSVVFKDVTVLQRRSNSVFRCHVGTMYQIPWEKGHVTFEEPPPDKRLMIHVTVNKKEWEPNLSELDTITDMFQQAFAAPDNTVIVTPKGVRVAVEDVLDSAEVKVLTVELTAALVNAHRNAN